MEIHGRLVVLRDEIRDSDFEDRFRWRNLEEWNYYDEPDKPFQPISREEFEKRRSRFLKAISGAHSWEIDLTIGKHIGWVGYYQLDEQEGHAYVGIALPEPEFRGKGYGTEAVRLVVGYLFREMNLQSARTKTWTGNQRMRRVAEKVGFRELGKSPHRAPFSVRGEPLEFIEYTISRADWLECGPSRPGA